MTVEVTEAEPLARAWPLLQRAWIDIVELTDGGPDPRSERQKLLDEMQFCQNDIKRFLAIRAGSTGDKL